MVPENERIDELVTCEWNYTGIEVNGLKYKTALVGGFNKKGDKYFLNEMAFLGDKVKQIGEYQSYSKIGYIPDLFEVWLRDEAHKRKDYNTPELTDVITSFFGEGEKIKIVIF